MTHTVENLHLEDSKVKAFRILTYWTVEIDGVPCKVSQYVQYRGNKYRYILRFKNKSIIKHKDYEEIRTKVNVLLSTWWRQNRLQSTKEYKSIEAKFIQTLD